MKSGELRQAAAAWLVHRGWTVEGVSALGTARQDVSAVDIVATNNVRRRFLFVQHWIWFDPDDFEVDDLWVPRFDMPSDNERRSIVCLNHCRAWAAWVDESLWFKLEDVGGRLLVPRADVKPVAVPWRLWAFDVVPEWLAVGWPNLRRPGTAGVPSTWRFHPNWTPEAAEAIKASTIENKTSGPWQSLGWYRYFKKTGDELGLPWAAND